MTDAEPLRHKFFWVFAILGLIGGVCCFSVSGGQPAKKALAATPCYPTYGYLDKQGHCTIPMRFACARKFSGGLAPVRVLRNSTPYNPGSGKWGFINHQGKMIVDPLFLEVLDFSEELCAVRCTVTPETQGSAQDFASETYSQEEYSRNYHRSGRFDHVLGQVSRIGKWGFINTSGEFKIKPQYDFAGSFVNGLAPVSLRGKWGFIDKTNKLVIPMQFKTAFCFSEGLAVVSKTTDGGYQYIDTSGNVAVPGKYRYAEPFLDGLAIVLSTNWKLIDRKGKVVYGNPSNWHYNKLADGLFPTWIEELPNEWRLQYNKTTERFSIFAKGLHLFFDHEWLGKPKNNIFGYVDKSGNFAFRCNLMDINYGDSFSEGLAGVCVGHGKYREKVFLDRSGEPKFKTPYWNAEPFSEGLSVVHTNYEPPNPRPYAQRRF